jgi:Rad51
MRAMSQNALVKSLPSQTLLKMNLPGIDDLFSGFEIGDFAMLHGTPTVLPLSSLLCVRAQLPTQLGGLGTNVIFVDGGNTFRLYQVSRIAQLHQLDPTQTLKRIYISRAFTAYQMTSIILEKLEETINKYNAKLVVISDIAGSFLDKDIQAEEAKRIFNQLTAYLSTFAEKNQLIMIATYPPHYPSRRNIFLRTLSCSRANVVISVRQSKHGQKLVLENHPRFTLGHAEFPSENLTLTEFMER